MSYAPNATQLRVLFALNGYVAAPWSKAQPAIVKALDMQPGHLNRCIQKMRERGWVRHASASNPATPALTGEGRVLLCSKAAESADVGDDPGATYVDHRSTAVAEEFIAARANRSGRAAC